MQGAGVCRVQLLEGMVGGLGANPRCWLVPVESISGPRTGRQCPRDEVPRAQGYSWAGMARLGLGDNPYLSERARAVLGWSPADPHEEALRRTGRWLATKQTVR